MDHPPGAYRTEWQLQIAVQSKTPAGDRADLPRMKGSLREPEKCHQ